MRTEVRMGDTFLRRYSETDSRLLRKPWWVFAYRMTSDGLQVLMRCDQKSVRQEWHSLVSVVKNWKLVIPNPSGQLLYSREISVSRQECHLSESGPDSIQKEDFSKEERVI